MIKRIKEEPSILLDVAILEDSNVTQKKAERQ